MNFTGPDNLGNPYLSQLNGVHDALPDVSVDRSKSEAEADAILRRALLRNGYVRNKAGELEYVGAGIEAEPAQRPAVARPQPRKRARRKTN
jgi:plasmid stability protein